MKKIISIILLLTFAGACSGKVIDVKSPCVSNETGPCGPKKPINDWWMKRSKNS